MVDDGAVAVQGTGTSPPADAYLVHERSSRVNDATERAAEAQRQQPDEPAEGPPVVFWTDQLDDLL